MSAVLLLTAGVVILIAVFLPWTQQANHTRRYTGWDLTRCSHGRWEGCGIHPDEIPLSHPMPLVVAVIVCAVAFVIIGSVTLWATLRERRFPRGLFRGIGWTAVLVGGFWSLSLPKSYPSHQGLHSWPYQRLWGYTIVVIGGALAFVAMVMFTVATSKTRVRRYPSPGTAGGTTTGTLARWADDPSGRHRLRYWDGHAWTEHVADAGPASTDPMVWPPDTVVGAAPPGAQPTPSAPPPPSTSVVPPVTTGKAPDRGSRLLSAVMLLAAGVVILVAVFLPWMQEGGPARDPMTGLDLPPGDRYTGWDLTHCWHGPWKACGITYTDAPPVSPGPPVIAIMVCATAFVIIGSVTLWATLRGRRVPRKPFLWVGWAAAGVGGFAGFTVVGIGDHRLWGLYIVTAAGFLALAGMIMFTAATSEPEAASVVPP